VDLSGGGANGYNRISQELIKRQKAARKLGDIRRAARRLLDLLASFFGLLFLSPSSCIFHSIARDSPARFLPRPRVAGTAVNLAF
jgi:lipopolysaccharide/colanic/teichoic acid biosynthesis glycosyltransferase